MNAPSGIPLGRRIFISFVISWFASVSLGIIYGARVVNRASFADLWVMGVVQVAAIISSVIALLLTPLVAWGLRSYSVIKWFLLLWLLMVAWVVTIIAVTHNGAFVLDGALLLTIGGLIGIKVMADR
jgi:hypothetical protein